MRTASIVAAAFAFGVGTFAMTRNAHALGPIDVEIGAKAGVATTPIKDSGVPNPLGFGIGARGGIDFLGFYGGVQLMYYFGGSDEVSVPGAESVKVSLHTFMYGVEAGYGFTLLDILTIRPQVGVGNATFSGSGEAAGFVNASGSGGSQSNLYIEPGVTGLVSLGGFFVGADANLLWFPGLDWAPNDSAKLCFSLHGQVGFKF
jgi:hypothetical protein